MKVFPSGLLMGPASLVQPLPEILVLLEREPFWSCV